MKVRAAILEDMTRPAPYARSRPLTVTTLDLEEPGPGEVLVEIRAAGLCHSDLSVIDGNRPRPLPMVLGHEAAGVVAAVGADVDLVPGDHVVAAFVPSCGACAPCVAQRPALCEPALATNTAGTLPSGQRRLSRSGESVNHHLGVSAFAEYAVVSRRSLVRIDPTLPFTHAALFGCAVLTGVGAVLNTVQLPPDASVAIVGLGGVGLAALLGALTCSPRHLIGIDLNAGKLAMGRTFGASQVVSAAAPDVIEQVRESTGGGVDVAFETAGSVRAFELAYAITRRGGTTVTAGLPHPREKFGIAQAGFVAEERTIRGSYLGSAVPSRDIPRYIELYRTGRLPVDRLLSDVISLDDINAAFDRLAAGETVRQVIVPGAQGA
jgi:Zn-dependent alcohol dehydrogenase